MEWFCVFQKMEDAEQMIPLHTARLLTVKGQRVCLAHTFEGFRAIQDACPHLGESLSKGKVNYLGEVVCPWHSYRYDLNSGEECSGRSVAAHRYPLEIKANALWIGIP